MKTTISSYWMLLASVALFFSCEKQDVRLHTVIHEDGTCKREVIYRQFGISKSTFERILLSLQEESNHVLSAELNMGLDNIILREDLSSLDILKLML